MSDQKKPRSDIFKNVEYIHVVRNKKRLLHIDGAEINGKNQTYLCYYLADKLGEDTYNLILKYSGDSVKKVSKIIAFYDPSKPKPEREPAAVLGDPLYREVLSLKEKYENAFSANTNVDQLLEMQKRSFDLERKFLEQQIKQLKQMNDDLEQELTETLEANLNDEKKENDLSISKVLLTMLNKLDQAPATPAATLKDNLGNEIPTEIFEVITKVDYSKIQPETIKGLANGMRLFIKMQNLPTKES